MKALIVDDDIFSIKGLEKGVHWKEDGICEVRQATSALAAKSVLKQESIDIVICDIEMPNETGIDFISWMREQDIPAVVIFYSCHADFIYAQTAVKLKAYDYILKPSPYSDMDKVLSGAVEERKRKQKEEQEKKHGERKERALNEKLMRAILDGTIPDTQEDIARMQEILGIKFQENVRFYLILHDIKYWEEILEGWNRIDIEFCLKNISGEIYELPGVNKKLTIPVYGKYYLNILECTKELDQEELFSRCRRFHQAFLKLTGYGLNSFVGDGCGLDGMKTQIACLLEMAERERQLQGVVASQPADNEKEMVWTEGFNQCYRELLAGNREKLSALADELLKKLETGPYFSYYCMEDIARKYAETAFAVLEIKNMDRAALTDDPVYREKEKKACWGPKSLENYLQYVNETVIEKMEKAGDERDVIAEIKGYIGLHLKEEISRENLAKLVFLNEDYMSRLFRKQEGISLTQYITEKKIERAKELLQLPEMTVTMASEGIGILNFPYFSKMFKRETGMSPSEYKKRYRGDDMDRQDNQKNGG